ncbi:MAG: replication-associated recombination protein A [Neomegalonema sp.]|nr:replication-associated recombination protein A [Neomegalonema sp.]
MADLFDGQPGHGNRAGPETDRPKADRPQADRPLADRLRPRTLAEVVGQDHLLGAEAPLGRMLAAGRLSSLILWGPPGVGKTTIARLLADETDLGFEQISAIFSGVAELRKVFEAARVRRLSGRGTLLFVDEIHRFNRAQQDGFLPHMEDGTITLVGATTENPSFELNAALLSRAQVLTLRPLDTAAMALLLARAEALEGRALPLTEEGRETVCAMADGDGRSLLNLAEELFALPARAPLDAAAVKASLQRRAPSYDKDRDGHYNLISALHKSVRGSDPDAALYWFARMLAGGEDPMFLARRLVRMAVEDIGLADPQAMGQALAAQQSYHFLGSPEGELALAQAVIYLALAPKSNAAYVAYKAAMRSAKETGSVPPPKHILNAPTALMEAEGYGAGYAYDHDAPDGFSGQNYFPDGMKRAKFYQPVERGYEREMAKRLAWFEKLRKER